MESVSGHYTARSTNTPLRNKSYLVGTNRMLRLRNNLFLALIFGLMMAACKPHVSLSGATIPPEAKTVSVAFFKNNSALGPPELSQKFSERLRDVVSQQTSLALMSRNADLQFDGYIEDYNVAPVAVADQQASQNRITISVKVIYFNKFDPAKNFEQLFTRFADFKSTESITAVGPGLYDEIFRQITEDVFNRAFNNW